MINFKNKNSGNLSKILLKEYPALTYAELKVLFRKKDIKVNGKRVNEDVKLTGGEDIVVYNREKKLNVVYEDNNICIVHKPMGVETTNVDKAYTQPSLEQISGYYACHRLDMNTEGLIILAKSKEIQKEMYKEFKLGNVHKFYTALIKGSPKKDTDILKDYLVKKDDRVYVYKDKVTNSHEIVTKYTVVDKNQDVSLVKIELLTGKTHQIRAHFAFIGHPVVGDNKYGDKEFNEKLKLKKQCLCSTKLSFSCESNNLKYLNNLSFETKPSFKL